MPHKTRDLYQFSVLLNVSRSAIHAIQEVIHFDDITGLASFKITPSGVDCALCLDDESVLKLRKFADCTSELASVAEDSISLVCSTDGEQFWNSPGPGAKQGNRWYIQFICDGRNNNRIRAALSESEPFVWPCSIDDSVTSRTYWPCLFGRFLWRLSAKDFLVDKADFRYLFLDVLDKERRKMEQLKKRFSGQAGMAMKLVREVIPEEVRIFVWRRDQAQCVRCGSQERLEFDHVIPVSKGGSNTERNIQLLCERCNREKSDSI